VTQKERKPIHQRNTGAGGPHSSRARQGKIIVTDVKCPTCNHVKGLMSVPSGKIKCARCKLTLTEGMQCSSNMVKVN